MIGNDRLSVDWLTMATTVYCLTSWEWGGCLSSFGNKGDFYCWVDRVYRLMVHLHCY